jgi:hypothetical protein
MFTEYVDHDSEDHFSATIQACIAGIATLRIVEWTQITAQTLAALTDTFA